MFDFIRKRKVSKIIKDYATLFNTTIPDDAVAREELVALKEVELQTLALAYDALNGWEFYRYPYKEPTGDYKNGHVLLYTPECCIPGYSTCIPVGRLSPTDSRVLKLLRKKKFQEMSQYYTNMPTFDSNKVYSMGGEKLWKTLK